MSRKMKKGSWEINVIEWIMVKNYWEYYRIEEWNEDDCAYCLVDGDFQETGLVSLEEIKPYIISRTKDLNLMPAPGWEWVEENNND